MFQSGKTLRSQQAKACKVLLYKHKRLLGRAPARPILQQARKPVTRRASSTDKTARKGNSQPQESDEGALVTNKFSESYAKGRLDPLPATHEAAPVKADGKAAATVEKAQEKQQRDPLTSGAKMEITLEKEEASVKQQLDPLTSQDEIDAPIDPQTEVDNVPIVMQRRLMISYDSPKDHRRRPGNSFALAARNFIAEFKGILLSILEKAAKPEEPDIPEAFGFTLSNEAILEFDEAHPPPGREPIPGFIRVAYDILLFFVDRVYEGKAIERFWFLETVARMPYFSYTTCLHLYETLGWWRTGGLRVIHFAEEWNELHHLLIMEALGGDRRWQDRFLGQHAAIFYYWALVICFLLSPKWSYKFSEMLETHAVSTYRQFIIENKENLKKLPAPNIAKQYYLSDDPYLYAMDSALCRGPVKAEPRTPPCENLYDVFVNILEDEWEHVKTMVMCQDYDMLETLKVTQTQYMPDDVVGRRDLWNRWAKDINDMDRMIELRKM